MVEELWWRYPVACYLTDGMFKIKVKKGAQWFYIDEDDMRKLYPDVQILDGWYP